MSSRAKRLIGVPTLSEPAAMVSRLWSFANWTIFWLRTPTALSYCRNFLERCRSMGRMRCSRTRLASFLMDRKRCKHTCKPRLAPSCDTSPQPKRFDRSTRVFGITDSCSGRFRGRLQWHWRFHSWAESSNAGLRSTRLFKLVDGFLFLFPVPALYPLHCPQGWGASLQAAACHRSQRPLSRQISAPKKKAAAIGLIAAASLPVRAKFGGS